MNLDFIARPLGMFLYFIYNTVAFKNYGLAIILFTLAIKLVLLPLTIKQLKSAAQMKEINPQIQELQRKYKNDKEKLNQEMLKLYSEHKVNPAGGCLPLLIQFPIILSLYWVIVQPLKFMLGKTPEQIKKIVDFVATQIGPERLSFQKELIALNYFSEHPDKLPNVADALKAAELVDMRFLGLNLGKIPTFKWDIISSDMATYLPLLIIPVIAVIATYLSAKMTMPKQEDSSQSAAMAATSNSMLYIGPLMTLMFSFQVPAGVGLYWTINSVFQILQQLYINKFILNDNKDKEVKTSK